MCELARSLLVLVHEHRFLFLRHLLCSASHRAVSSATAAACTTILRCAFFSRFAMLSGSIFGFGPEPLRAAAPAARGEALANHLQLR